MKRQANSETGITLVEVLVVITVIAILAAIIFPVLSAAKKRAKRATCMNNLSQINLGVRMYSDDSDDNSPSPGASAAATNLVSLYSGYKQLMKGTSERTAHRQRVTGFSPARPMPFIPAFSSQTPPPRITCATAFIASRRSIIPVTALTAAIT